MVRAVVAATARFPASPRRPEAPKVEDRLPPAVVYVHGAAAATIVVLLVALLVVE